MNLNITGIHKADIYCILRQPKWYIIYSFYFNVYL